MSDQPQPPRSIPSSGDGRPTQEMPHDRQAEEALLGSVLVNPEVYSREAIQSSNRLAEEDINGGIEWFCSVWAKTYYKCT